MEVLHPSNMQQGNGIAIRLWRRFITPPSAKTLWTRAALALWLTPPVMLWPLLLPILEPSAFLHLFGEHWQLYALFFGLPFVLGSVCWKQARRAR